MKSIFIVVGGGLAGLTTSLTIIENGGFVILLEKQSILGGIPQRHHQDEATLTNIQKDKSINDSEESFIKNTLHSAKENYLGKYSKELINILVKIVTQLLHGWKENNVNFDEVKMLGGHDFPRTHRSSE